MRAEINKMISSDIIEISQSPYTAMYEKPPPREIKEIIEFPDNDEYKFDKIKFYNKVAEDQEKRQNKYQ